MGYRTVAYPLTLNKNTVQRVFQLMHSQAPELTFVPHNTSMMSSTRRTDYAGQIHLSDASSTDSTHAIVVSSILR